ncbi:MAG: hypothetical protein JW915_02540 [Chitinispirillaceae bacterium]|nr:hypothetical protein [Chitinispirillaceae bacterium]
MISNSVEMQTSAICFSTEYTTASLTFKNGIPGFSALVSLYCSDTIIKIFHCPGGGV